MILQMTAMDCGAACLAMVLASHGGRASLAQCRRWLGIGRDGTTAAQMAATGRARGMTVRAFMASPESLAALPLPAVAHWEGDHYVLLERVSRRTLRIVDPALGRRRIGWDELAASMSGLVLTYQPGPSFSSEEPDASRHWSSELLCHLGGVRGALVRLAVVSLAIQTLAVAGPVISAEAIDSVTGAGARSMLAMLPALVCGLTLARFGAGRARLAMLVRLEAMFNTRLGESVVSHLLALPLAFFEERSNGDLRQRIASTFQIREALTAQSVEGLLDALLMVVYLSILIAFDVEYGVLVLVIGAAQASLLLGSSSRARRLHHRQLLAEAKTQHTLAQILDGIATVKASGAEDLLLARWRERLDRELGAKAEHDRFTGSVENATTSLQTLAPLLTLSLGVHQAISGHLGLGTILAMQTITMSVLLSLGSLVMAAQRLQSTRTHAERMRDVLAAPTEPRAANRVHRLRGGVELSGVSFRYAGHSRPAVDDVSVRIEPGAKVAIVGASGSGKSTLAMLLVGLYAPTAGRVYFDGVPAATLDPRDVRGQIGTVLQESFVFADSIRNNIALLRPAAAVCDIEYLAGLAALDGDIAEMPMRYDTRVGDSGQLVSGGQRQRIALARALAGSPAILLLDEATSHLDSLIEQRIGRELDRLNCTRIIIAHRLSTVRTADEVLVLDHGALVERGTHEELIARSGRYAALVDAQRAVEGTW